jgi:hypothetical protein
LAKMARPSRSGRFGIGSKLETMLFHSFYF